MGSPGGGSKDISPGWDTHPCGKRLQVSWAARAVLHAAAPGETHLEGMKRRYWEGCVRAEHRPVKISEDLLQVCSQSLACVYVELTADKP